MFQVVTLKGIAGIYDADDGFSNVMARIVATIHSYFLVDTRIPGHGAPVAVRSAPYQLW
jgi:hypothetical protein